MNPDGFRRHTLASPPFSCGLGAFIDIFLRLDIHVDIAGLEHYWARRADGFHLSDEGLAHFSSHSHFVREQRLFAFRDRVSFVVEHSLKLATRPAEERFLLVRDPVDSIYSWHRRWFSPDQRLLFADYAARQSHFHKHLPHPNLLAQPIDIYALHVLFWLAAEPDLIVIRYEDYKSDPVGVIKRVLAEARCKRSDEAIRTACEASAFQSIAQRPAVSQAWTQTNFRSVAFEWSERISRAEHDAQLTHEPMLSVARYLAYLTPPDTDLAVMRHNSLFWRNYAKWLREFSQKPSPGTGVAELISYCKEATIQTYVAAVDVVERNELSVRTEDLDAAGAAVASIRLLEDVFRDTVDYPLEKLARVLEAYTAILANCAPNGRLRNLTSMFTVKLARGDAR